MIEMTIDSIRVSHLNYQHVVILKEKGSDRYLPIWIGPAEADSISIKLQNTALPRPMTHDLLKNVICSLGSTSGTRVSRVLVNDLRADTFYAQIIFDSVDGPQPVSVKFPAHGTSHRGHANGSRMSLVWQGKEHELKIASEGQEAGGRFIEAVNEDGLLFEIHSRRATEKWLLEKIKLDSRPSDAIALAVRAEVPIYVEEAVLDKAGIMLDWETGKPIPIDKSSQKPGGAVFDFINTLDLDDIGKHKS